MILLYTRTSGHFFKQSLKEAQQAPKSEKPQEEAPENKNIQNWEYKEGLFTKLKNAVSEAYLDNQECIGQCIPDRGGLFTGWRK